MHMTRVGPTATLLGDGRVLVAGGALGAGDQVTSTAELYDPQANSWTMAASMSTPRLGAGAVLLRSGSVLVMGGSSSAANQNGSLASAETYNPRKDQWTPTPNMPNGHASAAVGRLPDGSVIVAGGTDWEGGYGLATPTVEIYRPETNRWRSAAPLHYARAATSGAMLSSGQLLVVGGSGRQGQFAQNTAEIYDWGTGAWTLLPRLPESRISPIVTALPAGRALVLGGSRVQAVEVFVPAPVAPLGAPATVPGAVSSNLPLVGVTALLALGVGTQAILRRRRPI
jgi:N-acetylneuraminic acid mutarotase